MTVFIFFALTLFCWVIELNICLSSWHLTSQLLYSRYCADIALKLINQPRTPPTTPSLPPAAPSTWQITNYTRVNYTLNKVGCTFCVRKHTFLGPACSWQTTNFLCVRIGIRAIIMMRIQLSSQPIELFSALRDMFIYLAAIGHACTCTA